MVLNQGVNLLKFDGISPQITASGPDEYGADIFSLLELIERLRRKKKDLFINVTIGTWPSPFWLFYAEFLSFPLSRPLPPLQLRSKHLSKAQSGGEDMTLASAGQAPPGSRPLLIEITKHTETWFKDRPFSRSLISCSTGSWFPISSSENTGWFSRLSLPAPFAP